jgi:hypothetical protein
MPDCSKIVVVFGSNLVQENTKWVSGTRLGTNRVMLESRHGAVAQLDRAEVS